MKIKKYSREMLLDPRGLSPKTVEWANENSRFNKEHGITLKKMQDALKEVRAIEMKLQTKYEEQEEELRMMDPKTLDENSVYKTK